MTTKDQQFMIETGAETEGSENDLLDSLAFVPQGSHLPFSRRNFRALVLHLLYAAESFGYDVSVESIADNYSRGFGVAINHQSESFITACAIIAKRDELDALFQPLLTNWRFDRISVATKLILRIAAYEMATSTVDRRIVINEAVELAKRFGEQDSYRFINGVLDKLSKQMPVQQDAAATMVPDQVSAAETH